jgi:hypothetical protein
MEERKFPHLDLKRAPTKLRAMATLNDLTSDQLRRAADLKEKITKLEQELNSLLGGTGTPVRATRQLSSAARARIGKAQRERWARVKGTAAQPPKKGARKKKVFSPEARAKIAAAAKARWAKAKAAGRTSLAAKPARKR